MPKQPVRRSVTLVVCAVIALTGCTSTKPTPSPSRSVSGSASATSGTPVPTGSVTPTTTATSTGSANPPPTPTVTPSETPVTTSSASPTATPSPTPSPSPAGSPSPVQPVRVGLEPVIEGLSSPVGIFNAGDERLFILEQEGYVKVAHPEGDHYVVTGIFLDIHMRVACCGERGILGIAFPPDFRDTSLFYVSYADNTHSVILDERHVSATDPDVADERGRRNLITLFKPHDYHWAGDMEFGRDGYLWITMGDGGFDQADRIGDPEHRAQDITQLFGKLLRIDVHDPDGEGPLTYGIPDDNPFVDEPGAAGEVWSYGFRNPWRWSFDSLTGDLWIGDVGHERIEEIDRALAPHPGKGMNFGWRLMEGNECYSPANDCDPDRITTRPIATYPHNDIGSGARCAVIGGTVYRGQKYPALASWYLFGDFCSGTIFGIDSAGDDRQPEDVLLDTDRTISSIGTDSAGELYLSDYLDGHIYRITGEPRR
ncbi:MAG: PQQ-dependent sugar dehydrogenase [Candidatus Limnocylindrales bacterium]